jgi:hypothetical protein
MPGIRHVGHLADLGAFSTRTLLRPLGRRAAPTNLGSTVAAGRAAVFRATMISLA